MPFFERFRVGFDANLDVFREGKAFFQYSAKSFPLPGRKAGRGTPADIEGVDLRFALQSLVPGLEFPFQRFKEKLDFLAPGSPTVEGAITALAAAKRDMQVAGKPDP